MDIIAKSYAMLVLDPTPFKLELRRRIRVYLRPAAAPTVPVAPRYDIPMPTVGMTPTYSSADAATADTLNVAQPADQITPTSSCPEVVADEGHHTRKSAYRPCSEA